MSLFRKSATELSELLVKKECSSREVVDSFLTRIEAIEPSLGSFITISAEQAREAADNIDKKRSAGESLPRLAGIPIALKDNIATKDVKTTSASKMLENFIPPYSATIVTKLEKSGVISLGKTNLDEFAMGASTETSYFKTTKNPWNTDYNPGGSSGGSGAAVAAGEVPFAIGTDTGGSIRLPAAFCGLVGLKPTYGTVSRYGITAFSSSLDQAGPMAHTVQDAALLFDVMKGYDSMDKTSLKIQRDDFTAQFGEGLKGITVGLPKEYFTKEISPEIQQAIQKAIRVFEEQGAVVKEVSLPSTEYALSAYYIISSAEASSNLARFDGVNYGFRAENVTTVDDLFNMTRSQGFGTEVQRRIMLGNYVLSADNYNDYYRNAIHMKNRISSEFTAVFDACDILLTPISPQTAGKVGAPKEDMTQSYQSDFCTVTANLAGVPALALPIGLGENNLPIGMQLIGRKFSEHRLFAAAHAYETAVGGFATISALKGDA